MILADKGNEILWIGSQELREYLATVTRPRLRSAAVSMNDALDRIAQFEDEFDIMEDGPSVTNTLATMGRNLPVAGKQIHDASIAITILAHGEWRLLAFNAGDFRRYSERIELVDMEDAD